MKFCSHRLGAFLGLWLSYPNSRWLGELYNCQKELNSQQLGEGLDQSRDLRFASFSTRFR